MYVCMYVCMYVAIRRPCAYHACTHAQILGRYTGKDCHNADVSASDSSTGDHECDYMLFQWSSWGECSIKCTCNARREGTV